MVENLETFVGHFQTTIQLSTQPRRLLRAILAFVNIVPTIIYKNKMILSRKQLYV